MVWWRFDVEVIRVVVLREVYCVFVLIKSLSSRYRSTMCWGMGSMNGGWLRVVRFMCVRLTLCI